MGRTRTCRRMPCILNLGSGLESADTGGASESKNCELPPENELEASRAMLARASVPVAAKTTVVKSAAGRIQLHLILFLTRELEQPKFL